MTGMPITPIYDKRYRHPVAGRVSDGPAKEAMAGRELTEWIF
jgi:hypothetical protein